MCGEIKMTVTSVVCVLLLPGLLVTAFPTNDGVDPGVSIQIPVSGVAEFSGTSTATGSVAILGVAPCPEVLLTSTPATLGVTLADAIIAEAGQDISAKLAEIDAFVEKELAMVKPQMQTALANTVTSEIDSSLDSTLSEIGSQISSELSKFDAFIERELAKTEDMVKSVLRNAESETAEIEQTVAKEFTEQESLIELVMLILQSFIESKLKERESLVKSELEKVNTFVETELEKVDAIVDSETAKINLFVEAELAKTDGLVQSELLEMESFLESKLAKTESLIETELKKVNAFVESKLAKTNALINSELSKVESLVEAELGKIEGIADSCAMNSDLIPVTGETLIIGSTGCPPILPTMEPLPIYLESFPILESEDYDESYASCFPRIDTGFVPPTIGAANPFIALSHVEAPYNNQYFGCNTQSTDPVLYHRKQLPIVNVIRGTARATGNIKLFSNFPCPPLKATEVGPDGKKYIWISKKSRDKEQSPRLKPELPDFSDSESATEAKDLSKGREDFEFLKPIPVCGKAVFEGTAPAFGSVSITGHSVQA